MVGVLNRGIPYPYTCLDMRPLSFFLFILSAEGFSCLLNLTVERAVIRGFKVAREVPSCPHLFCDDDSLMSFRVKHGDF